MNLELATHAPDKQKAIQLVSDFIRAGYHDWPETDGYHYLAVQLSGQLHATVQEYVLEEAIDHYKGYVNADDTTPSEIADFYEQPWQPGLAQVYHADITRNLTEAFNALLPNRYGIITDADTSALFNGTHHTLRSAA
ncbi:hypothetical protein [Arthrobacter sp. MDT1-65]